MKIKQKNIEKIAIKQKLEDEDLGEYDFEYDFPEFEEIEASANKLKLLEILEKVKKNETLYVSQLLNGYLRLKNGNELRDIFVSSSKNLIIIDTELLINLRETPKAKTQNAKEIMEQNTILYFKIIEGETEESFETFTKNQLQYDYEIMKKRVQTQVKSRQNLTKNGIEYHKIIFTITLSLICIYAANRDYSLKSLENEENMDYLKEEIEERSKHIYHAIAAMTSHKEFGEPSLQVEIFLVNIIGKMLLGKYPKTFLSLWEQWNDPIKKRREEGRARQKKHDDWNKDRKNRQKKLNDDRRKRDRQDTIRKRRADAKKKRRLISGNIESEIDDFLSYLSKESLKYETPDDFIHEFTQSGTLDTSNRDKHRFGRAFYNNDSLDILMNQSAFYEQIIYHSEAKKLTEIIYNKSDQITIYRAVDKKYKKIEIGDWVTLLKEYAIRHSDIVKENFKEKPHILEMKVNKSDIITESYDLNEFIYSPVELRNKGISLKHIWYSNATKERIRRAEQINKEKTNDILENIEKSKREYEKYYIDELDVFETYQTLLNKPKNIETYRKLWELRIKVERAPNLLQSSKNKFTKEFVKYKKTLYELGYTFEEIRAIDEEYRKIENK